MTTTARGPELLRALASITTGTYVLTARDGDERHGMSSSWVTQVSGDPALVAAAVDGTHATHALVERSGRFVLNVLGENGRHLEDWFHSAGAKRADNLASLAVEESPHGLPLLQGAFVNLECRVVHAYPAGDHTIFVAAVERVTERGSDRPLTTQDLDYVYVGEVIPQPRRP